ncbi:hypothetical protein BURPS406E_G0052 [Burkholderia pseudomallei 406e]|nr:hypothetical protein BPC006_II0934 [Burkholderia pseudomallei BPC006]EDO87508.1 hypothetical protein BURPS406E_G0052 [Burkholderia pseudomallei 406e]
MELFSVARPFTGCSQETSPHRYSEKPDKIRSPTDSNYFSHHELLFKNSSMQFYITKKISPLYSLRSRTDFYVKRKNLSDRAPWFEIQLFHRRSLDIS